MKTNLLYTFVIGAALVAASFPANAVLIDAKNTGINYELQMATTANPLTNIFALKITGINAATDTEGGRTGVDAISFGEPNNFVSAQMLVPATGFVQLSGGLNSTGCTLVDAAHFCFDNTSITDPQIVPTTPLAANSSLIFVFTETISSGTFASYNPDFKINWVGDKNNYDLISLNIGVTPGCPDCVITPVDVNLVPEPASLMLLGSGLIALGFIRRRSRNREILQMA